MKRRTMQRIYLREAALALLAARVAVALLPTSWLVAWASRPPRHPCRFATDKVGWVAWAVDAVGDKPWMRASCLARALAAQAMLRRRGIAGRLCLGVARRSGGLEAHAWIELGQTLVVGGAQAPRFTRLVEFGGRG